MRHPHSLTYVEAYAIVHEACGVIPAFVEDDILDIVLVAIQHDCGYSFFKEVVGEKRKAKAEDFQLYFGEEGFEIAEILASIGVISEKGFYIRRYIRDALALMEEWGIACI